MFTLALTLFIAILIVKWSTITVVSVHQWCAAMSSAEARMQFKMYDHQQL